LEITSAEDLKKLNENIFGCFLKVYPQANVEGGILKWLWIYDRKALAAKLAFWGLMEKLGAN